MKDTEVMRMLYHNSEVFNVGVEVGRKEVVDKALSTQMQDTTLTTAEM